MRFLDDSIFLESRIARRLYEKVKNLPIFDYHCHLSPAEIAEDRKFNDLAELWLAGDHYKWRLMRQYGIDENLITGSASGYEKFKAFCTALPSFIGHPVYHWAHLELKKYFGIVRPLSADTADEVWEQTKAAMASGEFTARKLIEQSGVTCVVTTDDPCDDLAWHKQLKAEVTAFEVLPCFRPDKAVNVGAIGFSDYVKKLEKTVGRDLKDFESFWTALEARLDYFAENGCTASDIAFVDFPKKGTLEQARTAYSAAVRGESLTAEQAGAYSFEVMARLARAFEKRKITMQLHGAALRNCNGALYSVLGPDCGVDAIANPFDIAAMQVLFDRIETDGGLPDTIVYTLNPNSYYAVATLLGSFAGGRAGKLQTGAAWWFCDHRDGIKEQLRTYAVSDGLGLFNGMLTDSRSFVSYARHDYFRRILCSVVGEWIGNGEYPEEQATELVKNICYYNAKNRFGGNL